MSTYYNKYQKYKKKYLDLKYKNFGCRKLEGPLPEYLVSLFGKNTNFSSIVNNNSDHRANKMLNCSINQILHSNILGDIYETNISKIVLIDGTNLMRNKWFITFALSIADEKHTNMIKNSVLKYIEGNTDKILFDGEIRWFREIIISVVEKLSRQENCAYVVCIQKMENDMYKKYEINKSTLYWLPIDCFSFINNKQVLCIRDDTFKFKNEADDFALVLLYLFFHSVKSGEIKNMYHISNQYNIYVLSGDGYDWFNGKSPDRLAIYVTNHKNNEGALDYRLEFQKRDIPINNIISYKLYDDGAVYCNENSNFDIYYKYMTIRKKLQFF